MFRCMKPGHTSRYYPELNKPRGNPGIPDPPVLKKKVNLVQGEMNPKNTEVSPNTFARCKDFQRKPKLLVTQTKVNHESSRQHG